MTGTNKEVYEFGKFRIEVSERILWRKKERLPLTDRAFDTLCMLVRNSNQLVTKESFFNEVWTDSIVEDNNLDKNISVLRKILGERDGQGKFIETVRGHGYRFVAEVNAVEPDFKIKTITILPFRSLVAGPRNESLELGMADTLISRLSGNEEIITRPLSAVRRYCSPEQDALDAARALGTEAVLDGWMQISGDRIRISTRFFRVCDGRQLWSGQFDENLSDIFAVQDSISEKVAAALKICIANEEKKHHTENVEAYELYMRGRYHAFKFAETETYKSIACFERAIEIDPDYALAYAGMADAYWTLSLVNDVPSNETMPKAKAAALKAIQIDETLAEAHTALGFITFWYDWDWKSSEKQYRRALEIKPNSAETHLAYGHLLSNIGRHEEAIAEMELSREINPLSLLTNACKGQALFFAGRYDEAVDLLNKTIDLEPNYPITYLFVSRVYSEKGMHRQAIAAATKARAVSGGMAEAVALIGYETAKSGDREKAVEVLEELRQLSIERPVPAYNFALVYNGLGETGKALDHLEKSFADKNALMVFLKVDPKWNNLRAEARFIELMRRMNFE